MRKKNSSKRPVKKQVNISLSQQDYDRLAGMSHDCYNGLVPVSTLAADLVMEGYTDRKAKKAP